VSKVPALCDSALTPIGICPQKFTRKLIAAGLLAAALAAAGCGGDDDSTATAPATTVETETTPVVTTATETEAQPAETTPTAPKTTPTETSPENAPGGAGDEEPARTLALFTGRGGRISPTIVRVPPFIAVEIKLRSGDGAEYALRFGSVTIRAGDTTTIDGLRPNESVTGVPEGAGNRVRISATAEPGP
jgi:hypothetical protein